jgi:A/G-specific adenine glycosylase
MHPLTHNQIKNFQTTVYDYYTKNKRDFVWRENITPYTILVSEVMLQQTQTSRVIPKFIAWLEKFPNFASLAQASDFEVLSSWQGLGYNKRGLALGIIAKKIITEFKGKLPNDPATLQTFPAIGPNTAGSICAFAFNNPTVFIETNIRTVFTHTFFAGQSEIDDKQLLPFITSTLDTENPRDWYYALMDYGVYLKQQIPKINFASKHHTQQKKFEGSARQVRGMIVKILTQTKSVHSDELIELVHFHLPENRHCVEKVMNKLIDEKVIKKNNDIVFL